MAKKKEVGAEYNCNPSQLYKAVRATLKVNRPCIVWGQPGSGKSQIMRDIAETSGREYIDIRALLLDPVDLRGIPWKSEKNRTRWAPPEFLPPTDTDKTYLINLEELPAAAPMVQMALYQLLLDRKCGEYELPPGAAIVACGNRIEDRGVFHKMSPASQSRLIHFNLEVSNKNWTQWALESDIAPEVIFFIEFKPELLNTYDPTSTDQTFACPRTWEFASQIINSNQKLPADVERMIFVGTVGEGPGVEFSSFLKIWRDLPHPQEVLDHPETARIPENASAMIALCGSLFSKVDKKNFPNVVTYAMRLPRPEVGEFLVGSCTRKNPGLQYSEAWIAWESARSI